MIHLQLERIWPLLGWGTRNNSTQYPPNPDQARRRRNTSPPDNAPTAPHCSAPLYFSFARNINSCTAMRSAVACLSISSRLATKRRLCADQFPIALSLRRTAPSSSSAQLDSLQAIRISPAKRKNLRFLSFDFVFHAVGDISFDNQHLEQAPQHNRAGIIPTALISAIDLIDHPDEITRRASYQRGVDDSIGIRLGCLPPAVLSVR